MKQIVANYRHGIKKIIKNITGSSNEDLEQEVYFKAWSNLGKYKEQGSFKKWINTITANMCRDYLRSSHFKNSMLNQGEESLVYMEDFQSSVEEKLASKQRQEEVLDAINQLKPKYKEIITLYEIKELNYEEISKIIKCPVGTVKSRLYNARKDLSIKLEHLI